MGCQETCASPSQNLGSSCPALDKRSARVYLSKPTFAKNTPAGSMTDYVAYYRVSTDRQGASGLGLDAQRQAVARHVTGGQLAAAFTEIESGRRDGTARSFTRRWPSAASAAPCC